MAHFHRFEISGGHTGSAYLYYSCVAATREELVRVVTETLASDLQLTCFVIAEDAVLRLECIEDGVVVTSENAYPALGIAIDRGPSVTFDGSGRPRGFDVEPHDDKSELVHAIMETPVFDELLDGARAFQVTLAPRTAPSPRTPPITVGEPVTFQREGVRLAQPYGWVGDFCEGWKLTTAPA